MKDGKHNQSYDDSFWTEVRDRAERIESIELSRMPHGFAPDGHQLTLAEWGEMFESPTRVVRQTEVVVGERRATTVSAWVGLHQWTRHGVDGSDRSKLIYDSTIITEDSHDPLNLTCLAASDEATTRLAHTMNVSEILTAFGVPTEPAWELATRATEGDLGYMDVEPDGKLTAWLRLDRAELAERWAEDYRIDRERNRGET